MEEKSKPTPNLKLRHERDRRMWSQQELADEVGTTPLNIGRWERGVTQPNPYFRKKLSEVFDKSAQELGLVSTKELDDTVTIPSQPTHIASSLTSQEATASLWNVPYRRNLFFTGREDTLTQLRDAFISETSTIALAQPQAISGLGGIGKTQTAVEYAYRYRDSYQAVFWVRAESPDLLISDYLTLATLLNLPERNEQDQSQITSAVIRWFDTHDNWLLILDNADELDAVSDYIPSAGKGHILLTTRAQAVGTIAQRIDIDKLGQEDGVILLLRRIKRLRGTTSLDSVPTALRSQAQAIVEAVDSLPLALDQAGAYIEETSCSLSDYLKFYKTRRTKLLRTRGRDVGGHPEPVAATWSLAFENIERANPAAADLLRLCAFLHPDAIPETMLIEGASELGPVLSLVAADELDLNEAIGQLLRYSLVKRDADENVLNIHRLVQAVVRDGMKDDEERMWVEHVVRMMSKVFPDTGKVEMWPVCQRYLPHIRICLEAIKQKHIEHVEMTTLLFQAGNYVQERGQYREAETFFQTALAIREKTLGSEHADVGLTMNRLGRLYREQGKYELAASFIMKSLEIVEKALGAEHLETAYILGNLAELYRLQNNFIQAEAIFLRSLAIEEQLLGKEHTEVAITVNNMALFYHYRGNLTQAASLYVRALKIQERTLGPDHPEVATLLNNLAALYSEQGKGLQAEPLLLRSIAIREQSLGLDHPYLAYSLNNLGALYHDRGDYEKAAPLLHRALAIREQALGRVHPLVATSIARLALLYMKQEKYKEAEERFLQALAVREQTLGPDHPDVARNLSRIAELYDLQGEHDQAHTTFLKALAIYDKTPDLVHPELAATLKRFAFIYRKQSNYEMAQSLYQRALTIEERSFGTEHPQIAVTLTYFADLLQEMGSTSEAVALQERAQTIRSKQS